MHPAPAKPDSANYETIIENPLSLAGVGEYVEEPRDPQLVMSFNDARGERSAKFSFWDLPYLMMLPRKATKAETEAASATEAVHKDHVSGASCNTKL
jgi:hypothetical protein